MWLRANVRRARHRFGQRWYGRTTEGKYMPEAEAKAAGYWPTANGQ